MTAQEMWSWYSRESGIDGAYQAWSFGDDADQLARLALEGIKTATASAFVLYEVEHVPLPAVGEYSVILDSNENAVCIIQTTRVYIVPFDEVSEVHAFREGEGNRSLEYWRTVHERFFKRELVESGLLFDNHMKVVCEEFVRVFP